MEELCELTGQKKPKMDRKRARKDYLRLSGPALGKPPKDMVLSRQAKKQEYQDSCDRNAVEGIFGTGKTAYGLGRIMAHLQETAVCVIGIALLLLNLSRSIRAALALFCLAAFLRLAECSLSKLRSTNLSSLS